MMYNHRPGMIDRSSPPLEFQGTDAPCSVKTPHSMSQGFETTDYGMPSFWVVLSITEELLSSNNVRVIRSEGLPTTTVSEDDLSRKG